MPQIETKGAIDWKGALPFMVLLFVVAVLEMQGIITGEGFVGLTALAALVLLILPLLNSSGIPAKTINLWFVRAAILFILAASFTVVMSIGSDKIVSTAYILTSIAIGLAWLMLFIGSLIALINVKA